MYKTLPLPRSLWRSLLWFALVASLLAALVPSLARLAHAGQAGWVDVCTAQTTYKVAIQLGDAADSESGQHPAAQNHCPYCTPNAASFALPPHDVAPLVLASAPVILPHAAPAFVPGAQFLGSAARPRAPPSLSA